MKIIKEIAGRLFALWALLLFTITMFIFIIPFLFIFFLPEPKRTVIFMKISRIWMGIFLPGIGCPLTIRGKEHFKEGENYIVLFNHNSLMDVPVSSPGTPGGNKTIAKIEMAKVPVFGILYKMGSVLVDRKSDASRRESMIKMKEVLEMGLHMCIYPEGTRNKTDQPLKAFHNGAFRLAIDTRKSIIPAVIFNTKDILPSTKSFFLQPGKLAMHFLEPIPVQETDTAEKIKEKVFEIMQQYYIAHHT